MTHSDGLVVQIGTYNANLQGDEGLPQDLVDWLVPSLRVSSFLASTRTAPDIVAVGFQELLPLQLGLAGLSKPVMRSRDELIRSQLEQHAPNKERYVLVATAINVCVALLVYARDDTVARRVADVQTQWTSCGPGWLGNKGAVGVRFRLVGDVNKGARDETFTFVNAHLTPHQKNWKRRVDDYRHVVQTLLFPPPPPPLTSNAPLGSAPTTEETGYTNIYHTTHLFFFGDLNFRIEVPQGMSRTDLEAKIRTEDGREELRTHDQLSISREKGEALTSLREAEFWKFQCTYKYVHGQVDEYSSKRIPSWTDRVLFTTASDHPTDLSRSAITPLLYTPIPSYTVSDHKPVMALLKLPSNTSVSSSTTSPTRATLLRQPETFVNDPYWRWKRYTGKVLGWAVGWTWCLFWFVGAGSAVVGLCGSLLGMMGVFWWNTPND